MNTLSFDNVDLISIQRAAPKNGSCSSQDYNDSSREILRDLLSVTDWINQNLIPVLNALPETAAMGLTGLTMFANPGDTSPLFFNKSTTTSYTVAEVCANLNSTATSVSQKISDLNARVLKMQTLLASTGQTDILASVQSFSDQIKNVQSLVNTIRMTVAGYEARFQQTKGVRVDIVEIAAAGVLEMDISFDVPYPNDNYTVSVGIEDETGGLALTGWKKLPNGRGIHVYIHNGSTSPVDGGILHLIGQADAPSAA